LIGGFNEIRKWQLRYHRVGVALDALATDIEEQTVFEV
jgi:glycine reductase